MGDGSNQPTPLVHDGIMYLTNIGWILCNMMRVDRGGMMKKLIRKVLGYVRRAGGRFHPGGDPRRSAYTCKTVPETYVR